MFEKFRKPAAGLAFAGVVGMSLAMPLAAGAAPADTLPVFPEKVQIGTGIKNDEGYVYNGTIGSLIKYDKDKFDVKFSSKDLPKDVLTEGGGLDAYDDATKTDVKEGEYEATVDVYKKGTDEKVKTQNVKIVVSNQEQPVANRKVHVSDDPADPMYKEDLGNGKLVVEDGKVYRLLPEKMVPGDTYGFNYSKTVKGTDPNFWNDPSRSVWQRMWFQMPLYPDSNGNWETIAAAMNEPVSAYPKLADAFNPADDLVPGVENTVKLKPEYAKYAGHLTLDDYSKETKENNPPNWKLRVEGDSIHVTPPADAKKGDTYYARVFQDVDGENPGLFAKLTVGDKPAPTETPKVEEQKNTNSDISKADDSGKPKNLPKTGVANS